MKNRADVSAIESTVEQIEAWLIAHLAARRGTAPQTIDARERFSHYGLDSLGATRLLAELAQVLGRSLSPTLVWEHPTWRARAPRRGGGARARLLELRRWSASLTICPTPCTMTNPQKALEAYPAPGDRPGAGAVGEIPLAHQPCLGYRPEKFSTSSLCNNPLPKDPLSARSRWKSAFDSAEMSALVSFASTVILR